MEERAAARAAAEAAAPAAGKKSNVTRRPRGRSVVETDDLCIVDKLMNEIRGGTIKLRRTVPARQA